MICYGSTGSGKTHTLSGAEWKKNGIIQQAITYARQQAIAKGLKNFKVTCFMVQIYKSHIKDLLRRDDDPILALHLDFNDDGSVSIRNICLHEADGFLDADGDTKLIKVLNKGLDNRLMRSTEANEASSRSHLLFAVTMSHTDEITGATVSGKMMFVDLAGSERLAKLGFSLYLYEEAIFINESLAILGKTIWRLSKGQHPREIDYDCNILTSLLKDTLGGEAKALMFICIGPSIMDAEATRDTLRFARSTGKIKARNDFIDKKFMWNIEEDKAINSITTSTKYICKKPRYNPDRSSTVPDIGGLAGKSLADLATLKPKTIHFGHWMY